MSVLIALRWHILTYDDREAKKKDGRYMYCIWTVIMYIQHAVFSSSLGIMCNKDLLFIQVIFFFSFSLKTFFFLSFFCHTTCQTMVKYICQNGINYRLKNKFVCIKCYKPKQKILKISDLPDIFSFFVFIIFPFEAEEKRGKENGIMVFNFHYTAHYTQTSRI